MTLRRSFEKPSLSPRAEEQKTFHLPPGFEIQLVASEPEISKPMNMAFDARGRLWITQSREYPFPVLPVENAGRDKIQVLENFDVTGKAQKITTFADGLNIPIGLYPYQGGAIAFSIPNVYSFHDTNGDGRADQKKLFLGRFGYEKDTHGLTSHFRRGFDGWLYADHGFNNDSTLTAEGWKLHQAEFREHLPDSNRRLAYRAIHLGPGESIRADVRSLGGPVVLRLSQFTALYADARRVLSQLRKATRRPWIRAQHMRSQPRFHRDCRHGLLCGH